MVKKKRHFKVYFSRTKKASRLSLGIQHWGLKIYQVDLNDDSRLTFDLSMARSNLHSPTLVLGNVAILEESCMASADMQWSFYSGERIWPMGLLFIYGLQRSMCNYTVYDTILL